MTVIVDARVIEVLLLGQGDRQRQLQDLPILGDVWVQIASDIGGMHDLLITPHHDYSAARVARLLADLTEGAPVGPGARKMSYLTGIVAARLSLEDIWSVLIPMTDWWLERARDLENKWPKDHFRQFIKNEFDAIVEGERPIQGDRAERASPPRERNIDQLRNAEHQLIRLGLLIGVLRAACGANARPDAANSPDTFGPFGRLAQQLSSTEIAKLGSKALDEALGNFTWLAEQEAVQDMPLRGVVWTASSNRRAEYATSRSVPAIKADAARQLFSISCKGIGWAVLDSGIDRHPAFDDLTDVPPTKDARPRSRIKATYDFNRIRDILNSGNRFDNARRTELAASLASATGKPAADIEKKLLLLASAIGDERSVDWNTIESLVRRDDPDPPLHPHGTHVAGILAGCWQVPGAPGMPPEIKQLGVCPDISLYDFRVLGPDAEQTEFAVIAALQFIGYLNRRNAFPVIDGINMSLSIPSDVRNYACGHTPVCVEAEARVAQGTVVVVAAGNRGYQRFRLADGSEFASYAASSITDPGNAAGVITVGATHRYWPHTYGVSFFSSRGPTGDGRLKPDIVAPGERIESTVPGAALDVKDGTSMAAPHVSGAAALLIARHRELRGQPVEIKRILCDTATDLGRERSFQGFGMVDVLRAIQSV
ncbi:MAG: S8 family peptidase [Sphingomonas sp.]